MLKNTFSRVMLYIHNLFLTAVVEILMKMNFQVSMRRLMQSGVRGELDVGSSR